MTSKHLMLEAPLTASPVLAKHLGFNEAILLEQVRLCTEMNRDNGKEYVHEGRVWMYRTIADWHKVLKWLSPKTITRAFESLEAKGIILRKQLASDAYDRTMWYTIDHEALDAYMTKAEGV